MTFFWYVIFMHFKFGLHLLVSQKMVRKSGELQQVLLFQTRGKRPSRRVELGFLLTGGTVPEHIFYLTDKLSSKQLLVDTGLAISILPHSSTAHTSSMNDHFASSDWVFHLPLALLSIRVTAKDRFAYSSAEMV